VEVTLTSEELFWTFAKDFKERCSIFIPKATAKRILDVKVPLYLIQHNIKFDFNKDGKEYSFETFQTFKGVTAKMNLFEDQGELFGEASTLYGAQILIRDSNGVIVELRNVTFYVTLFNLVRF
jgi:hypothetical protein